MAKKRKARAAKSEGVVSREDISPEILRTIWRGIERNDWMAFLQRNHPDSKWSWTNDGIQGCCPFHGEKTPSFKINFIRQQAKCFGCGAYYWNPVQFYAKVSDPPKTYVDALLDIKANYNPAHLPQRVIKQLTQLDRHRRMKQIVYHVTNAELVDAVSSTEIELAYAKPLVEYLQVTRQIPVVYHSLPIGVMPQQRRLEERMTEYCLKTNEDVTLVNDAVEYFKPFFQDTTWVGAIIFFYGGSPEHVSRLKLRQMPLKDDASIFSQPSNKEKLIVFVPDDLEPDLGVFGLFGVPAYQIKLASKYAKIFHFVEGEYDALNLIANQLENTRCDFIVFAGGGGATSGVDLLSNFGFEECYIVTDDDEPGETLVQTILQKTHKTACRIFMWPNELKAPGAIKAKTDPDQAIKDHGFELVEKHLKDINNFKMPHKWALEQADVEMSNVPKDDVRKLTSIAAAWGLFVTNSAERHKYIADIAERYQIPPGPVWNAVLTDDDSDVAFIQRITDTLLRRYMIISTEFENGRWAYRCWHKASRRTIMLPIGDAKMLRSAIESAEGKDLLKFILEDVGEPGFEKTRFEDEEDPAYLGRLEVYIKYLVPAVSNMGRYAPSPSEVRHVNSGCHAFKPTPEEPDKPFTLYLVNGDRLYKGIYPTENGDKIVWRECEGPMDGKIYVYLQHQVPRTIHPQIIDEDTLNKSPKYSVAEMYKLIHSIIDKGWGFKKQQTTVDLLTAFVMLIPISDAVDRQPMVMFTGDQSSGKTSFVGGLIGKDALSRINIVQNSLFMANFTQAGVRQSMNYSSVCLCLDEFENTSGNDRVSNRVQDVLQLIRGLANENAVTRYGSASGKAQLTMLRFPVCAAGIHGLKDPADLSRFILIEMDRNLSRITPETAIMEHIGEETVIEIRNELPRLMYHAAFQVYQAHEHIKHEFRHGGKTLPKDINLTRTREMFYGLMAIMKLAGRDYTKFIEQYFEDYRMVLERLSRVSVSSELFDAIFYTPAIPIPSTSGVGGIDTMSVHRILKDGKGDLMNAKNMGVYYDEERQWLIVHWPTATPCVLRQVQRFQGATPGYLKSQAQRCQYHHLDDKVLHSKILLEDKWKQLLGDTQILHISAYDVQAFVKDSRKINQVITKPMKGREVTDLTQDPRFKKRLEERQWPKPESPKKEEETGTSTKTGAVAGSKKSKRSGGSGGENSGGANSGGIDDDFTY